MKISIIQPSRNNLRYLQWSYESIRKNQGDHEVEICVADDFSNDGTNEWCQQTAERDENFKWIRNSGPTRLGHTILYDELINEVASHDICMIFHADMYLCPGALDQIESELDTRTIVSLTRIEPPLHPDGPEKILKDFGTEPEEFNEEEFLTWLRDYKSSYHGPSITEGVFAPWAFWKQDFQKIGGHDPLFAPQSKEDSDIFNRFLLDGITFKQSWLGCVYHMTCRGSRRNTHDGAKNIRTDNPEWLAQNERSARNFVRKWGNFVHHDEYMKPIIPPKYDIALVLKNCDNHDLDVLHLLEPWVSVIYVDDVTLHSLYIRNEQQNTKFDLEKRVRIKTEDTLKNDVIVIVDMNNITANDFDVIRSLSQIIYEATPGEYEIGNAPIHVKINDLNNHVADLINVNALKEQMINDIYI